MSMSGPVPPEQIRQLATPELALKLLAALANGGTLNANNMLRGAQQTFEHNGERDTDFLLARLSDAWAWLESLALIGPDTNNTTSSWQRLTQAGGRQQPTPTR